MSRDEFLATAVRISEQLWQDDPPELLQQARTLADGSMPTTTSCTSRSPERPRSTTD